MRTPILASLGILGLFLTALLSGCGTSQVVATLELVTGAAEAAVTALQATGTMPPGTATLVNAYLSQVSTATEFAATELDSSDPTDVKLSKIVAEFAQITVPALPAGTAQAVVSAIQAVATAVTNFLASLPPASELKTAAAQAPAPIKLSSSDRSKLMRIRVRIETVKSKVATEIVMGTAVVAVLITIEVVPKS